MEKSKNKSLRIKVLLNLFLCIILLGFFSDAVVCYAGGTPVPQKENLRNGTVDNAVKNKNSGGSKSLSENLTTYVDSMESGEVSSEMKKLASGGTSVTGMAGQIFVIIRTVVFILILIFSLIALVKLALEGGKGRGEGKQLLGRSLISIFAVASVASFIGVVWSVGSGLW